MDKMKRILTRELAKNGVISATYCTSDENLRYKDMPIDKLPDDILPSELDSYKFIKYSKDDSTDEEIKQLLLAKQNSQLKTIKNCAIFFVVLAIIGIIVGCIVGFQLYNAIHSASSLTSSTPIY